MKYSGIDLHANNSVVTVTGEENWIVAEKRLPNDLTKIVGLLAVLSRYPLMSVILAGTSASSDNANSAVGATRKLIH